MPEPLPSSASRRSWREPWSRYDALISPLVGIGDLHPQTSGFVRAGVAESAQLRAYREAGAIGDMAWQIFDGAGRLFPCELNQRIIGVTLDELSALPQTIAVAAGSRKAAAIVGALRSGAIDVLCTDEETAVTHISGQK